MDRGGDQRNETSQGDGFHTFPGLQSALRDRWTLCCQPRILGDKSPSVYI